MFQSKCTLNSRFNGMRQDVNVITALCDLLCCVSSCRPLSSTESLRQLSQQLNGLVSGVFTSTTFNSVKFHSSGVIMLCHIATGVLFNWGCVASILGRNSLEAFSDLPVVTSGHKCLDIIQLVHQTR